MKSSVAIPLLFARWIIGSTMPSCRRLLPRTTSPKRPILCSREMRIVCAGSHHSKKIDLCGHATLASAYVIFQYLKPEMKAVTFNSQSGPLYVTREGDLLCLDFPARAPVACSVSETLAAGLGTPPREVLCSRDYLAIYDSEDEVRTLQPNFEALKTLDRLGVIATAPGKTADFVSRFFAPGAGVPEDPVTGSAHCTLTPYWARRLDKTKMRAFQVSARGGELFCELRGNRVLITGRCVKYMDGIIYV